ncbi:hypothetical protein B0H10DRAFT_2191596 [Mycena sp. CBHHK59/15]|nr:hypothetical protein B0H10DRAFT_2191596 [Mycena sp. CBHHK59/15]
MDMQSYGIFPRISLSTVCMLTPPHCSDKATAKAVQCVLPGSNGMHDNEVVPAQPGLDLGSSALYVHPDTHCVQSELTDDHCWAVSPIVNGCRPEEGNGKQDEIHQDAPWERKMTQTVNMIPFSNVLPSHAPLHKRKMLYHKHHHLVSPKEEEPLMCPSLLLRRVSSKSGPLPAIPTWVVKTLTTDSSPGAQAQEQEVHCPQLWCALPGSELAQASSQKPGQPSHGFIKPGQATGLAWAGLGFWLQIFQTKPGHQARA